MDDRLNSSVLDVSLAYYKPVQCLAAGDTLHPSFMLCKLAFNPAEGALIKIHGCARGSHRSIDDIS